MGSRTADATSNPAAKEPPVPAPAQQLSIGQYLIRRLQDYGIRDVFGVPGDYVLAFYGMVEQSPINLVGCTREDCAGFAADAYARVNGMGAICVTYCVGGLSICNSIAGAYAEKSPVVAISGAPGLGERVNDPLLHHKVRDFRTQLEVFEKLCVAWTELSDPVSAFYEIDRVLNAAARFKRPVYIELPRDMVSVTPHIGHGFQHHPFEGEIGVVDEAADETAALLAASKRPLIIAGVEIHRFGLQDKMLELAEGSGIPVAATLLGKSVIRETHPLYVGIYEGAMGKSEITEFVEDSDCILMLGAFMTDLNLGIYTADLDPHKCIDASSETLRIGHHHYHNVRLDAFVDALIKRKPEVTARPLPQAVAPDRAVFEVVPQARITISRMIARLNQQIDENTIVIADPGDSLFAATELTTKAMTEFLSPAYYTSMGFAAPAVLGVQIARPDRRVLAICGDGAFQMTGMELSNVVRRGFAPIVIVMDNHGYGTERFLRPGEWAYNEIHPWRYAKIIEVLGGGAGYEVRTEGDFDAAIRKAWTDTGQLSLIHVHQAVDDASESLRRLAARLGQRV
jgi:indolepyruvate decarboxylase